MNKKKAIIIAGAAAIALVAVLLVIVFWPKNSGKEKKRTATIDEGIDMSEQQLRHPDGILSRKHQADPRRKQKGLV